MRVLDSIMEIRVSRTEKQRLSEVAKGRGMTLSEYVREAARSAQRPAA